MPEPTIETKDDGTLVVDAGRTTRIVVPPGGPMRPMQDPNDAGFPDVIIDQREGFAAPTMTTIQEVETFFEDSFRKRGIVSELVTEPVVAYINHSRWVADCVCGGGMLCWPQHARTACLDCGRSYQVAWGDPLERSQVVRTLAIRDPRHRNWDPRQLDDQGEPVETVEMLERENMLVLGEKGL